MSTGEGTGATDNSTSFDWNLERPERNIWGVRLYDVRRAKEILSQISHEVKTIDLNQHGEAIGQFLEDVKFRDGVNWDEVDTDFPVSFMRTPEGIIPIDGRHRLKKALDDGAHSITAFYLNEEESETIRLA